jgi:hypothetical protein
MQTPGSRLPGETGGRVARLGRAEDSLVWDQGARPDQLPACVSASPATRRRCLLLLRRGTDAKVVYPEEDYFVTSPYTGDYTFNGQTVFLTFWHRPLHAMTDAFTRAGFKISVISEPPFSPETPRELLPPDLGDRTAFLCVLFFVLETV